MEKIKIEIGKKYVRADGQVVRCRGVDDSDVPYLIGNSWYRKDLSLYVGNPNNDNPNYKIIKEHKKPKKTKLTEQQMQAIADAKIKIENSLNKAAHSIVDETLVETLSLAFVALWLLTPQAHKTVQDGTCDA